MNMPFHSAAYNLLSSPSLLLCRARNLWLSFKNVVRYSMQYLDEIISSKMNLDEIKRFASDVVQPNVLRRLNTISSKNLQISFRVTRISNAFDPSSIVAYEINEKNILSSDCLEYFVSAIDLQKIESIAIIVILKSLQQPNLLRLL